MSEEDNEAEDQVHAPDEPGRGAAPQDSDHNTKRRRNRMTVVLMTALLCGAAYGAYRYAWPDDHRIDAVKVLPKSENVLAPIATPVIETKTMTSRLVAEPATMPFGQLVAGREHQTLSFTLTALDGPVDVEGIVLPFAQTNGLDMRAETCQGHQLAKNEKCVVSVTFSPLQATSLSNNILVQGKTYDVGGASGGATHKFSTAVAIFGQSVAPPPDPPKPVAFDYDKARMNNLQSSYLAGRARASLGEQSRTAWNAPSAPVAGDWADKGFSKNESSFPVDMTRVVTMDKDIPAVLKVPIDARNPSRAVAVVERDVYGGDGRMVVIERGSTLIGSVAAIADSSEEKVGISWQRLMRPDGVMFQFEATTGDAMGRAGALAYIDNRWLERFGTTGLASLVEAGLTVGLNGNTTSTTQNGTNVTGINGEITTGGTTTIAQNARSVASQQLRQDLQPLYEQFKREQLALPVIRTVPAGTRLTIWPSTDLWLKAVPSTQVTTAQNQSTSLGPTTQPKSIYATAEGAGAAGGGGSGALAGAAGTAPAGSAPTAVDTSIGTKTAAGMLRDRMTLTGSTAGSSGLNPYLGGYARQSGQVPGSYGAPGGYGLSAGGVSGVSAPPWSMGQ